MTAPATDTLDPSQEGFFADPYPQYELLRREAPIHQTVLGVWVVLKWQDVSQVLGDPGYSVDSNLSPAISRLQRHAARSTGHTSAPYSSSLLFRDPPGHTRVRGLLTRALAALRPADLEREVVRETEQLLSAIDATVPFDLVSDLAEPLTLRVMGKILGLGPSTDLAKVRSLATSISRLLDPMLALSDAPEIRSSIDELNALVGEFLRWKATRLDLDSDVLANVLGQRNSGQWPDETELVENVGLLLIAGQETSINLIGNGFLALLRHPSELARLRSDPSLMPQAVHELLRFDSPVQFTRRVARRPMKIGRHEVEEGGFVLAAIGAANRDPDIFGPSSEMLKVDRSDSSHHLSFSTGIHKCFGARIALAQASAAVGGMLRHFPQVELAESNPSWRRRFALRGLERLILHCER